MTVDTSADTSGGVDVFRSEVRQFIARHLRPGVGAAARESGTIHDWDLHRALAGAGWIVAPWPTHAGGQNRTPLEMMLLVNELSLADAPIDGWLTTLIVASTLRHVGTDWLKEQVLPAVIAGDALCCLGFSEPDAGSDVASVVTRAAHQPDGHWVVNGQKIFTSFAHEARWVLLLTRTDPTATRHHGLSVFLVPLDSVGITVQPIQTLGGERLNVVFYDDVVVDDRWRVGGVGGGWSVLMSSLAFERGGAGGGSARFVGSLERLIEDVRLHAMESTGANCWLTDPLARERYARAAVDLEVSRLLSTRSAMTSHRGDDASIEAAMAKVFSSEALQKASQSLLDLLGPAGQLRSGDPAAAMAGALEHSYRDSLACTIYGGTSEMMRSIIATQGLGLPRG